MRGRRVRRQELAGLLQDFRPVFPGQPIPASLPPTGLHLGMGSPASRASDPTPPGARPPGWPSKDPPSPWPVPSPDPPPARVAHRWDPWPPPIHGPPQRPPRSGRPLPDSPPATVATPTPPPAPPPGTGRRPGPGPAGSGPAEAARGDLAWAGVWPPARSRKPGLTGPGAARPRRRSPLAVIPARGHQGPGAARDPRPAGIRAGPGASSGWPGRSSGPPPAALPTGPGAAAAGPGTRGGDRFQSVPGRASKFQVAAEEGLRRLQHLHLHGAGAKPMALLGEEMQFHGHPPAR